MRLVTLTGAGGTGKTRLALAAAAELAPELRDGALFVDLAPVADPRLLASTIADQLDVQEGARPLIETIAEHLESKRMLLVLDNLEQLLPAVSLIADLLAAAPSLLVLATSRAPLRLSAEHEYPVPPLPVPHGDLPFEELVRSDALHLFTARARAVNPAFALDEGAARSVAEICRRLDGLPLAIELAAARAKLLSPAEMIERLPHALGQGPRDVPARQRTLTAAIQWSIDLLDPRRGLRSAASPCSPAAPPSKRQSACAPRGSKRLGRSSTTASSSTTRRAAVSACWRRFERVRSSSSTRQVPRPYAGATPSG